MKLLLLSLLTFGSFHAFSADLPPGTYALADVAGQVASAEPLCPEGMTCVTNGTILNMTYTGGCLDSLVQPVYTVVGQDVFVHAQVALNENSKRVRCAALPIFTDTMQLIMKFPPFKIHFMGTNEVLIVE